MTRIHPTAIVEPGARLAGTVAIGPYCHIGSEVEIADGVTLHAHVGVAGRPIIGGMWGVERDVIPYGSVMGDRARLSGVNIIGMQRRGFSREEIQSLRGAYQLLFADAGTLSERVEDIAARFSDVKPVKDIID